MAVKELRGENSQIIFTACFESFPLYYFKLTYIVLHMSVKELRIKNQGGENS